MAFDLREYTARRKVVTLFGASFHVYDASGQGEPLSGDELPFSDGHRGG